VQATLEQQLAGLVADRAAYERAINAATTAFYGGLFFWVNLLGLLLQAFIVSRILKYAGFGVLLLTTPVVSLLAYGAMFTTPLLALVKAVKVAENASNYSVNNTARHVLWLPTTKQMLYQAKPAIDTLFVRLGDGFAALTVLLGTRVWLLEVKHFIAVNLVLVLLWIVVAVFLVAEHRRWTKAAESGKSISELQ
jgi:AAA family ATP:ADP antiporter